MPGFDQRGPMNEGPMTGRQAGRCAAGYIQNCDEATYEKWSIDNRPGLGRGCRSSMRRGKCQGVLRGRGLAKTSKAAADFSSAPEDTLSRRVQQLRSELEAIENQLRQFDDQ